MPFTIPNTADAAFAAQAGPDKVDIDILVQAYLGNGVVVGCGVGAQGTPDMTLVVGAGIVRVSGTDVVVASGNVTITTAHATLPRIDLVVIDNGGLKAAVAGTPAASPVTPTLPASSTALAMVYVPANDTAINTNQVTDKRVFVNPVISADTFTNFATNYSGSPANFPGVLFFVTDVAGGTLYRSDGGTWAQVAAPVAVGGVTASGAILRGIVDAKGDLVTATAADTPARVAVGTPGQLLIPDSGETTGLDWVDNPYAGSIRPTGALAESIPRQQANLSTNPAGTTGQLRMVAIWLPARLVVTSISFVIGTTGITSGTHGWFALFDSARALLRQSTDDTTPTEASANAVVTYNLSSTFTTTYAGLHYLGCMWTASTMPTLAGFAGNVVTAGLAPIISGTSTGSLTTTAPNPAAAITALSGIPYAYVS